jgi:hypothetical protein
VKGFLEGAGAEMESPAPSGDTAAAFLLFIALLRSTVSETPSLNTRDEPSASAASRPSAESKKALAKGLPGRCWMPQTFCGGKREGYEQEREHVEEATTNLIGK